MTTTKIQIPCQKLISGGQTGVDRAVLDACLKYSFPCGGWYPKKPVRIVRPDANPAHIIPWLILNNINTLNVAHPRKSEWINAYTLTYRFITELIVKIKSSASVNQP
nr:putative molybdenum carrier protein [uncultured Draconibacterium sp.]